MNGRVQTFKCCGCGNVFQDTQRPSHGVGGYFMGYSWGGTECPRCGSIYMAQLAERLTGDANPAAAALTA